MSLKAQPVPPVPPETVRVAHAAFPTGTLYLQLGEELGTLVQDEDCVTLVAQEGPPALPPWRLALITRLQLRENLWDRQAAEAVRVRMEGKYLRRLERTDAGFDCSVWSDFRARLSAGGAEELLFEKLLHWRPSAGLGKARGKQRTDATPVVAARRALNRIELGGETLRAALTALAVRAPDGGRTLARPEWYARDQRRSEEGRFPKGKEARFL